MRLTAHMSGEIYWTHDARTNDKDEALARAVSKNYGKTCYFIKDHGASTESRWIGQVFKNTGQQGGSPVGTSVSKKLAIDFE